MALPEKIKTERIDRSPHQNSLQTAEDSRESCLDVKPIVCVTSNEDDHNNNNSQPTNASTSLASDTLPSSNDIIAIDNEETDSDAYLTDDNEDDGDHVKRGVQHKAATKTRKTKQNGYVSSDSDEHEKCIICLCRFLGQTIGQPEVCNHNFCLECIEEWSKQVSACPVDRKIYSTILVKQDLDGKVTSKITVTADNQGRPNNDDIAPEDVTYCEVCGQCDREDRLLLCDGCDFGYHLECLNPPLDFVPIEDWYCPDCARVNTSNTTPQQTAVLNLIAHGVSSEYSLIQRYRRRRMNTSSISELIRSRINERRRVRVQQNTDDAGPSRLSSNRSRTISIAPARVTTFSSLDLPSRSVATRTKSVAPRTKSVAKKKPIKSVKGKRASKSKRKTTKRKTSKGVKRKRKSYRKTKRSKKSKTASKLSSTDVRLRIASRMGIRDVHGTPFGLATFKKSSGSGKSKTARCGDLATAKESAGIASLSLCGTEPTHVQPITDPNLFSLENTGSNAYSEIPDYDSGVSSGAAIVASLVRRRISPSSAARILAKKTLMAQSRVHAAVRSVQPISGSIDLLGSILSAQENLFGASSETGTVAPKKVHDSAALQMTSDNENRADVNLVNNDQQSAESSQTGEDETIVSAPASTSVSAQNNGESRYSASYGDQSSFKEQYQGDKHVEKSSSPESDKAAPSKKNDLNKIERRKLENFNQQQSDVSLSDDEQTNNSLKYSETKFENQSKNAMDRSDIDTASISDDKGYNQRITPHNTTPLPEEINSEHHLDRISEHEMKRDWLNDGSQQSSPSHASLVFEPQSPLSYVPSDQHAKLINRIGYDTESSESSVDHARKEEPTKNNETDQTKLKDLNEADKNEGAGTTLLDGTRVKRCKHGRLIPISKDKSKRHERSRDRRSQSPNDERDRRSASRGGHRPEVVKKTDRVDDKDKHDKISDRDLIPTERRRRRRGRRGGRKRHQRVFSRSRSRSDSRDSHRHHFDRCDKRSSRYRRSRSASRGIGPRNHSRDTPPRYRYRSKSRSISRVHSRSRSRSLSQTHRHHRRKHRRSYSRDRSIEDRHRSSYGHRSSRHSRGRDLDRSSYRSKSPRDRHRSSHRHRSRNEGRDGLGRAERRDESKYHDRTSKETIRKKSKEDYQDSPSTSNNNIVSISKRELAERSLNARLGLTQQPRGDNLQSLNSDDLPGNSNRFDSVPHTEAGLAQLSKSTAQDSVGRPLPKIGSISLTPATRRPLVLNDMFCEDLDQPACSRKPDQPVIEAHSLPDSQLFRSSTAPDINEDLKSGMFPDDHVLESNNMPRSATILTNEKQDLNNVNKTGTERSESMMNLSSDTNDGIASSANSMGPATPMDDIYDPEAPVGPISPVDSPPIEDDFPQQDMLDQLQVPLSNRGRQMEQSNSVQDMLNVWRNSNPEFYQLLSDTGTGNNNRATAFHSVCDQLTGTSVVTGNVGSAQFMQSSELSGRARSRSPSRRTTTSSGSLPGETSTSTAMSLSQQEKIMQKMHLQERVIEAVKQAVRPYYASREITKDEYKEVLRRAVPKICRSGEIIPGKIQHLVKGYVKSVKSHKKHRQL